MAQKCETPAIEAGVTRNQLAGGFHVLSTPFTLTPQSLVALHIGVDWLANRTAIVEGGDACVSGSSLNERRRPHGLV